MTSTPPTEKHRHPLLIELGLASPPAKNANGKRSRQKQQVPRPVGALDVLERLLETNVVSSDQLRTAHTSLVQERGEQSSAKEVKKQEHKPPDYRTRHIALRIYYEGTNYSGLAENVGQPGDNSVEKYVFQALQKTRLIQSREGCQYSRCGRTDKGVSAVGQVIALQLKSAIPLEASWDEQGENLVTEESKLPTRNSSIKVWVPPKKKRKKGQAPEATPRQEKELTEYAYEKMLNSLLTPDIRVLGWCPVSKEFSARFSASDRTYRYFFVNGTLHLPSIREGLSLLEGTHDFRNLCKLNVVEVSNFVRTIHSAQLIERDEVCYFEIKGQAFLWHQIRCIVSVLFLIGRGLESPSVITELLNVKQHPGKPSYPLACEFPLVLHGCGYRNNLQLHYSVQNLWTVTCQLQGQWETLVLKAARVRNCLDALSQVQTVRRKELVDFGTNRLKERLKKERNKQKSTTTEREERWSKALDDITEEEKEASPPVLHVSWADAMAWLGRYDMVPDGYGLVDHVHIPLLERSKGTTLEEKIEALQQSTTSKRSQRYEENVAKKQKSETTDAAFYEHMLKQGSTG